MAIIGEIRHKRVSMAKIAKTNEEIPANNIRSIRKAKGLTLEQVADAVGTDARTLQRIETQAMRLSDKWIFPIAKALSVEPAELLVKEDALVVNRTDVRPAGVEMPPATTLPNDLPVRGTAAGSHLGGAFQFEGGIVDYVRRPPALIGAMNAYGLYIEGVSMVPEHNPGDLRFAHPDRPPRVGDSVIVQIQIGPNQAMESMIGRLLKRTEKSVFIGKLNPEATVELKRETVVAIHKVLTVNELFGV